MEIGLSIIRSGSPFAPLAALRETVIFGLGLIPSHIVVGLPSYSRERGTSVRWEAHGLCPIHRVNCVTGEPVPPEQILEKIEKLARP